MPKFSVAQENDAEALALKLYGLEVAAQKHLEILQENPAALMDAYNQYTQIAPPNWPAPADLKKALEQAEQELEVECTTFLDRIRAVCNSVFVVQALSQFMAIKDNDVYMLMMKKRSDMHTAASYQRGNTKPISVSPPLSPLFAQQLGIPAAPEPMSPANTTSEYPLTLPAREFTFREMANTKRAKITSAALETYRQDPDRLRNLAFIGKYGLQIETFRVSSVLKTEDECLLYLVHVDEGAEAVCYRHEDVVAMIANSESFQLVPHCQVTRTLLVRMRRNFRPLATLHFRYGVLSVPGYTFGKTPQASCAPRSQTVGSRTAHEQALLPAPDMATRSAQRLAFRAQSVYG
ncbi:hypothetical protein B0H12DRAFT_1267634 [Mycena haematopus]|nr:hypothetical protein B0H12DRAFT_1267634 [Mycena haematopus]